MLQQTPEFERFLQPRPFGKRHAGGDMDPGFAPGQRDMERRGDECQLDYSLLRGGDEYFACHFELGAQWLAAKLAGLTFNP